MQWWPRGLGHYSMAREVDGLNPSRGIFLLSFNVVQKDQQAEIKNTNLFSLGIWVIQSTSERRKSEIRTMPKSEHMLVRISDNNLCPKSEQNHLDIWTFHKARLFRVIQNKFFI